MFQQSVPAYGEGKLFVATSAGYLYAFSASDGQRLWKVKASPNDYNQNFCGPATISNGSLFLITCNFYGDGGLYCIDEQNGSVIWRESIQRSDAPPAIDDRKVYVTGGAYGFSDRITYCFDAVSGALLWQTTPEQAIGGWTCSAVVADGKVFVGNMSEGNNSMGETYSRLFALDQNTGKTIWEADDCGETVAIFDGVVLSAGNDGRVHTFGAK